MKIKFWVPIVSEIRSLISISSHWEIKLKPNFYTWLINFITDEK